jgi:hypothetical protein
MVSGFSLLAFRFHEWEELHEAKKEILTVITTEAQRHGENKK